MSKPDSKSISAPDARFTAELTWLYTAAGSPTHDAVSRAAAQWVPPVRLAKQTLSDWLTGKSVPADPSSVLRLVRHLTELARRRPGFVARPVDWRKLHAEAKLARRDAHDRYRDGDVERVNTVARAERFVADSTPEAQDARPPLGLPVAACDPIALEVHRAIDISGDDRQPILPPYVERAHDRRLRRIADEVLVGGKRMVTLVGESSTGKTRACWELAPTPFS